MGNKTKSASFRLDRKTIALIIAGVAAILCAIGVFGSSLIVKAVGNSGGQSQMEKIGTIDLAYIFKDGWDEIKQLAETGRGIESFKLVLMIISFFGACGGVVFGLGKTLYSFVKNEEINVKFNLGIVLFASAQYIFMSRYALAYTSVQLKEIGQELKLIYTLGWGGILVTIGFFLGLIALFVKEFESKESFFTRKNVCLKLATIVTFFVGLYALTNIAKLSVEGDGDLFAISLNSFDWIYYVKAGEISKAQGLAIVSFILGLVSVLAFLTALFTYVTGLEGKYSKRISLISTIGFTASSLLANILISISAYKAIPDTAGKFSANFGFTAIVSLILGVALIVLTAVGYKGEKAKA